MIVFVIICITFTSLAKSMFASNLRDPGFGRRSGGDPGVSGAFNSFNKTPETSFGNREQRTENIGQRTEDIGRRTEDRGQSTGQRTGRKTEDRGHTTETETETEIAMIRGLNKRAAQPCAPLGPADYLLYSTGVLFNDRFLT